MMGVALKVLKGLSSNIKNAPFIDGSLHYETDTGRLWVDSLDDNVENRKCVSGNVLEVNATLDHTKWNHGSYDLQLEQVAATSSGIIGVAQSADEDTYEAAKGAAMCLRGQRDGHLTIVATSNVPDVDIPVTLFLFG